MSRPGFRAARMGEQDRGHGLGVYLAIRSNSLPSMSAKVVQRD
jgi:hypothetical protein